MTNQQTYGFVSFCFVASEVLNMLLASREGAECLGNSSHCRSALVSALQLRQLLWTLVSHNWKSVVAMGLLIVTQLRTGWTNREQPQRKSYLMLPKSIFVVQENSVLL